MRQASPPVAGAGQTRRAPMRAVDLDAVLAIEKRAYDFPWTRGNFIDSLAAGYLAERLLDARGALLGYFVAAGGPDEMHLLNLTVAPELQGRGHARAMLDVLARDPANPSDDPDDQGRGFSGGALTAGMRLWSKAGWTSRVRHDAALIQLPDGRRFVLVIFTDGHAQERSIIPSLVRRVLGAVTQ